MHRSLVVGEALNSNPQTTNPTGVLLAQGKPYRYGYVMSAVLPM